MATRQRRVDIEVEIPRGVTAARAARARVAADLEDLLTTADMTGSRAMIVQRIKQLVADEVEGDAVVIRSSAMEVLVAWAAYIAQLDLQLAGTVV